MKHMMQSGTRGLRAIACVGTLFFAQCAAANDLRILLLLSNDSAPYQSFSNTLTKSLPASIQTAVMPVQNASFIDPPAHTDLIVAVGIKAAEAALRQTAIPVLTTMVPQAGYESLLNNSVPSKPARTVTAIYLNQPWARQVDFVYALLPEHRKIAVLFSPASKNEAGHLRDAVSVRGGSLVAQSVDSDAALFSDLENILQNSEVLLALPDNAIYSSSNVRNILLTTYRLNVPLIGFSQAYVNAGAIAALFSTPEQLAVQTAATVLDFAQSGHLHTAQYPDTYTIAVNQQVAHSLGIELDSDEMLRARMKKNRRGAYD